ncbi:hypothetical protein [Burkholderia gladioli]|uniref:hypothetical protein n=1 Tax=Burkholderia gladioli TaxID=28095 RepID=UPI001640C987|nr:hypothetical protein [Burkholderia gladioli]
MSDKLSDEQIERAFDSFKCTHPGAAPWYDVPERFLASTVRRLLAASPAPAITMPTLNDAMRAVLTNENCIYGTPDELYAALVMAALVMAAPAIPALDEKAFAAWVRTQDGGVGIYDAYLHGTKAAPAISESDMLRHRAVAAEARLEHVIKILTRIHGFLLPNDVRLPDGRIFEFNNPEAEHEMLRGLRDAILAAPDEIAAIDAARKGQKS